MGFATKLANVLEKFREKHQPDKDELCEDWSTFV
jgi:hypothetical protein